MSGRRYPPAKWVLPTVVDPPTRTCYTIPVPDDPYHRAAFRGALLALASATKWQDDLAHTAKEAAAVWREIYDLVVQCEESTGTNGESWDEDLTSLCEALRFQNGKLQALCCGTWTDISGQPAQGWLPASGGSGTTPPVAGACTDYQAAMSGNGYWYAPFTVNTGDTITISNAAGATYNPANGTWTCTDGSQFFAGACLPGTVTAGGNPMPAVPTGKIIAKIGATFYDVYNGVFTVPGGIVAQPIQFQVNYASIATSSGDITFTVHYCNNASATFTHTFNFLLTNAGFTPVVDNANNEGLWTASSGWAAVPYQNGSGQWVTNLDLVKNFAARQLTSVSMTYNLTKGAFGFTGVNNGFIVSVAGASPVTQAVAANTDADGTGKVMTLNTGLVSSYTRIELVLRVRFNATNVSPGSGIVTQLVVSGIGTDPF